MAQRVVRRERERVTHPEGGRLMVKQSLVAATDLNLMMARWRKDGTGLAHVNEGEPTYGDFSSGLDYMAALNAVEAAKKDFMRLPAPVRAHVSNDPGEFLALVFDPERRNELEELGLVPAGEVVRPDPGKLEELSVEDQVVLLEAAKARLEAAKEAVKRNPPQGGE